MVHQIGIREELAVLGNHMLDMSDHVREMMFQAERHHQEALAAIKEQGQRHHQQLMQMLHVIQQQINNPTLTLQLPQGMGMFDSR